MEKQVVQFQFGGQGVTLKQVPLRVQATGAVVITMGETQILATVVGAKNVKSGQKFSLSRCIIRKKHMPQERSPVAILSVKVVRPKKRH